MSKTLIPSALRTEVIERAQGWCEYCHLPEEVGFAPYEIDHVIAEQHGGKTESDNLAYACMICNKRKGPNIASIAPDTGMIVPLYNPRKQKWEEHFQLRHDGTIMGLTPEGRATASLLEFNSSERVQERRGLMKLGGSV